MIAGSYVDMRNSKWRAAAVYSLPPRPLANAGPYISRHLFYLVCFTVRQLSYTPLHIPILKYTSYTGC